MVVYFLLSYYQFIIGDGDNLYDFTYVENVAYGHICAERTLAAGGPRAEKVAGQVLGLPFWLIVLFCFVGLA